MATSISENTAVSTHHLITHMAQNPFFPDWQPAGTVDFELPPNVIPTVARPRNRHQEEDDEFGISSSSTDAPEWLPDSPRNTLPANDQEMEQFRSNFPEIIEGQRYIHRPDRRVERTRVSNQIARYCTSCGRSVLSYRPGKCPVCWRFLHSALPASILATNVCACACRCPSELDDASDPDYVPENDDSDEEMDFTQESNPGDVVPNHHEGDGNTAVLNQIPMSDGNPGEILAGTIYQDQHGVMMQQSLRAEAASHYAAAVGPQDPTHENSSMFNDQNQVTETEASILYRQPFREELALLLNNGYSRDDLRRLLPETTYEESSSYLPADPYSFGEAPAVCHACRRNYGPALRNAITLAFIQHVIDADPIQALMDGPVADRMRLLTRRRSVVAQMPLVELCPTCFLPQRAPNYLRDEWHDCDCVCLCVDHQGRPALSFRPPWSVLPAPRLPPFLMPSTPRRGDGTNPRPFMQF